MQISAQISLYPLRQPRISPAIESAWTILKKHSLRVKKGEMSTVVAGEAENIFAAMKEIFEASAGKGPVSMVVTLSNACPI